MPHCSHNFGWLRTSTLLAASLAGVPFASALILGGAAEVQTAAPADDPGWANVVSPNGCSGVYLGNRWVLTAGHVGAGSVAVSGTIYPVQPGAAVRLRTPDGVGVTDLTLFRLAADPGLPELVVVASPLATNTPVTMIGCGRSRGPAVAYDANWLAGGEPVEYSGYLWGTVRVKGWGTNRIAGVEEFSTPYGQIISYVTDFTAAAESDATPDEAQGALYDSGGGVFAKIAHRWQLAGIMVEIGGFAGQPANTALQGNATYSMELSAYRPQIEAVRALAEPFAIWGYDRFRDAGFDASADPDGDGFTNLEEYAFGLDPQVANPASAAPQVALADYADGAALTVTFTRDTAATDAPVLVEVSDDLATWQAGDDATVVVSSTSLGGTVERMVVRDCATAVNAPRRFLRVRVAR